MELKKSQLRIGQETSTIHMLVKMIFLALFLSIFITGCKKIEEVKEDSEPVPVGETDPEPDPDPEEDPEDETPEETEETIVVGFTEQQKSVVEGGSVQFTIQLSEALTEDLNISFSFSGKAENDSDYSYDSAESVITAGQTTANLMINTLTDDFYDGVEQLSIEIASVENQTIAISSSMSTAVLEIRDTQSAPSVELSVDKFVVSEGDSVKIALSSSPLAHDRIDVRLSLDVTDSRGLNYSTTRDTRILGGGFKTTTLFTPADYNLKNDATVTVSIDTVNGADATIGTANSVDILVADTSESLANIDDPLDLAVGGPWGVAPSHTSSRGLWWLDPIRMSGINWIRGFNQSRSGADASLTQIVAADYRQSGIFQWSAGDGFPDEDIAGWENRISEILEDSAGRVRVWEVWNEPPNFSDDKDPTHYAAIVQSAYQAVKAHDPTMAVGLTASSVNLNFMDQALQAGAKDHFDFITLHPYETIHLVSKDGFEGQFMSIVPSVRKMLREHNPEKENVPIIFTEIGQPLASRQQSLNDFTPEELAQAKKDQASTVVKAYTLSLAQGVTRVHWFQIKDDEGMKFGLIEGGKDNWQPRPSYLAVQTLIEHLGQTPNYIGWVLLNDEHYGFVFENDDKHILVTWPRSENASTLNFSAEVLAINPLTQETELSDTHQLPDHPMVYSEVPMSLVNEAAINVMKPFPWEGDYSNANEVVASAGNEQGLHYAGTPIEAVVDGETVWDIGFSNGNRFAVDPNFMSYDSEPIRITAVVRFKGDVNDSTIANAGFNLKYEKVDGLAYTGRSGGWRTVPRDNNWHEIVWDVNDAQFVGFWGYNFSLDSDSTKHSQYYLKSIKVEKVQ